MSGYRSAGASRDYPALYPTDPWMSLGMAFLKSRGRNKCYYDRGKLSIDVPRTLRMEHSTAIMEDAGKAIDGREQPASSVNTTSTTTREASASRSDHNEGGDSRTNNYGRRKRKGDFGDSRMQHGSRRGGRQDNKRHKKGDMGRAEYLYGLKTNRTRRSRH